MLNSFIEIFTTQSYFILGLIVVLTASVVYNQSVTKTYESEIASLGDDILAFNDLLDGITTTMVELHHQIDAKDERIKDLEEELDAIVGERRLW